MKTIASWLVLVAGIMAVPAVAQHVLVVGQRAYVRPGALYAQPLRGPTHTMGAPAYAVGTGGAQALPVVTAYAPQYQPNVIYIGGPGSCGPAPWVYPRYNSPNVIYFGQMQAYRDGYHFRHCR